MKKYLILVLCSLSLFGETETNVVIRQNSHINIYEYGPLIFSEYTNFAFYIEHNIKWYSKELRNNLITLDRNQALQTNWVTVETIDLGTCNKVTQVGKVITNEVVSLVYETQTNLVTFKIGESRYSEQQTLTNEKIITNGNSILISTNDIILTMPSNPKSIYWR